LNSLACARYRNNPDLQNVKIGNQNFFWMPVTLYNLIFDKPSGQHREVQGMGHPFSEDRTGRGFQSMLDFFNKTLRDLDDTSDDSDVCDSYEALLQNWLASQSVV
jgi:hypothetical protein